MEKSIQIANLLNLLKQQLLQARKNAVADLCLKEEKRYREENEVLKKEVTKLRLKLIEEETKNGVIQVPLPTTLKSSITLPSPTNVVAPSGGDKAGKAIQETSVKKDKPSNVVAKKQEEKKAPKDLEKKDKSQANKAVELNTESSNAVDVSKLNMKIGRIVEVNKHPDADSLYVEQVDLGEKQKRTIVSGLVKHVPIEEMQGRLGVFLTNLKPAKMRGVMSEGMIMCASTPEKVEIIEPPPGVQVGERVIVQGFPGDADDQLNPKKKIWETIQPDLRINDQGLATYKGALWTIEGKGHFKAPSLKNTPIK